MYDSSEDIDLARYSEGRLLGLRINRYSWWTHWRELADYELPRRYKWIVTPNQSYRGSPINQHILDSTGTLAARNLASGMMSGISSPTRPWFKLKIGRIDTTQTTPASLWLSECERLMGMVFQESNFYNAMATLYFDLVIFGTAVIIIYEDFENVIHCFNPCAGEYYIDSDGNLRPVIFYREFTYTTSQCVDEFGYDACSDTVKQLYDQRDGSGKTKEIIIAHAIEPNKEGDKYGVPAHFKFREVYWEWGGSASPQGGGTGAKGLLRKKGYNEQPNITIRWDLVSNDAYGRSPGMDALPDIKQLQLESKRKAQAIDKVVNPPLKADIQLKNQPASMLPGGVTYVSGMGNGNPGIESVYGNWKPDIGAMSEDLKEIRERIKKTFFNDLFQTASQFETRSNITAVEWDMRKSESLVMLGPVLERIYDEGLKPIVERVFAMMARANIFPPPPPEIAGKNIDIQFVSMLATAQAAAQSSGIERTLQLAGGLAGIDPAVMDNINVDFAFDKYSSLLQNDPRMIRSPEALAAIRKQRADQQAQQQQAEMAEKLAAGAKTLSETQVGGGKNALQSMTGVQ